MLSLLITLLVILVVFAIVYWIITLLPLPAPTKNIVLAIMGLILLIWLLYTVFGGGPALIHLDGPRR